jgi:hypothetical protein
MTTHAAVFDVRDPAGFRPDYGALLEFENGLDLDVPERSTQPFRVLGYGEICAVFAVQQPGLAGLACKRLSIFETRAEFDRYTTAYHAYNGLLEAAGLRLPTHGHCALVNARGRVIFYILQEQLARDCFGPRILAQRTGEARLEFFRLILQQLSGVWVYNRTRDYQKLGVDGQLSNWALATDAPTSDVPLRYLDTSTPFLRVNGVDQLEPELFLRTAPSYLAWVLRTLFLKQVMDRYFDFRKVVLDLVANLYKEGQAALIPELIAATNQFFSTEAAGEHLAPLSPREVHDYYREDARIWSLYLSGRYLDRFVRRRLLRREYPYLLPGRIRR